MFIISVIVIFFFFLFILYALGKDDAVLFRKNVLLESLFNLAFLGLGAGLLISKIIFLTVNYPYIHQDFYRFLLLQNPYYSLAGGIFGVWVFLFWKTRSHKMPTLRIADIVSSAFFTVSPFGIGLMILIDGKKDQWYDYVLICCAVAIIGGIFYWRKKIERGDIKDGTLAFGSCMIFSLVGFLIDCVSMNEKLIGPISGEGMLFFVLSILFGVLLFQNEKMGGKIAFS